MKLTDYLKSLPYQQQKLVRDWLTLVIDVQEKVDLDATVKMIKVEEIPERRKHPR